MEEGAEIVAGKPGAPSSKKIEVELRELDVILRDKFGPNLIVDCFTTKNLVPLGENYGSTMLSVEADVKLDGIDSRPERLSLVAKMTPPTEFQKLMFDSPYTFPKEIYMFTDIIPAFKTLEREYGVVPETEIFDPLPELYGARLSLDREDVKKFDHDAVILMENLRTKNYACGDRTVGVDFRHAEFLVKALARFHALGIALKIKKPDLFEGVRTRAESMAFKDEMMSGISESMLNDARRIPALAPYLDRVEKVIKTADNERNWLKTPAEPWASIVHTDLWVNNVMFRDGDDGNPLDVKFIDFQNYLYQNPTRDLVFFIFSSCSKEVRTSHVEELIDLYYERLISHLKKFGIRDLSSFSRASFDEQVADAAFIEYLHSVLMAKIILADPTSDPGQADPEVLLDRPSSDKCLELMGEISLKFIDRNWI